MDTIKFLFTELLSKIFSLWVPKYKKYRTCTNIKKHRTEATQTKTQKTTKTLN
jgi:hypothetical protein